MNIERHHSDEVILRELGARLAGLRLAHSMTQAHLATQAGVSKRTVERLESGQSGQLSSLIRVLRGLDLMKELNVLVPPTRPGPMDLLRLQGKTRRRASRTSLPDDHDEPWTWGADE